MKIVSSEPYSVFLLLTYTSHCSLYFQRSMTDPAGRDRGKKMSWDELQLVPPATSKLKVALQGLFSEESNSP